MSWAKFWKGAEFSPILFRYVTTLKRLLTESFKYPVSLFIRMALEILMKGSDHPKHDTFEVVDFGDNGISTVPWIHFVPNFGDISGSIPGLPPGGRWRRNVTPVRWPARRPSRRGSIFGPVLAPFRVQCWAQNLLDSDHFRRNVCFRQKRGSSFQDHELINLKNKATFCKLF